MNSDEFLSINAIQLNQLLDSGEEFALLDVREAGAFSKGHLWLANTMHVSRLEFKVRRFIPNTKVTIILCDENDGTAQRAALVLRTMGYSNIHILANGIQSWVDAGFSLVTGNYVIAHSLGYVIEDQYATPVITAMELKQKIDQKEKIIMVDCRSEEDYQASSIEGSISVPAAEMARRIPDLVDDETTTVVAHCAGITRAALGGQGLLNCGIKNPVLSLIDGTRGWDLIGENLISHQIIPDISPSAKSKYFSSRAAEQLTIDYNLQVTTAEALEDWQLAHSERTAYKIDVRSRREYLEGHYDDTMWIPGGELAGMAIDHLAVQNARLCLFADSDCARAEISAMWMKLQGWNDVVIVKNWKEFKPLQIGLEKDYYPELSRSKSDFIDAQECHELMEAGESVLLDFSTSTQYAEQHIPGATWMSRAQIVSQVNQLKNYRSIICISEDGSVAILAAQDIHKLTASSVKVLKWGNSSWDQDDLEQGIISVIGAIDDQDFMTLPLKPNREETVTWHKQGIRWRHQLYEQFKQDQPNKFKF